MESSSALRGIKINNLGMLDSQGYSHSMIASRSIESYLIIQTGFFHADPHPGNLAIDTDGSLIYYDFGMMGEIKSFTLERLLSLFYAVYEKDANKVMKSLIDLEVLQATGDLSPIKKLLVVLASGISMKIYQKSTASLRAKIQWIASAESFGPSQHSAQLEQKTVAELKNIDPWEVQGTSEEKNTRPSSTSMIWSMFMPL
ncbi:protein ACTIVITY OF BC1 COMPLEX KINASE 7, chloroplastic-like [Oryza brachyantha]|uniref:protein ACTIVITY OF BC1 COMPLEX KINASE 7, chloroplastic-like n=1 Tax=Oryza brachyantha TaxID=4533 RepID=UPI001ADB965C|nr:protein ACTIVITY OF BC1 COMPLEX KINASE 7, chloroplastic-like [Oryza brachyantha]